MRGIAYLAPFPLLTSFGWANFLDFNLRLQEAEGR